MIEFVNKILCGEVLKTLKQYPDESIDVVITSPPYYSARFYGKELNMAWGGKEDCVHEWEVYNNEFVKKIEVGQVSKGVTGSNEYLQRQSICKKCGAWYGQLGLEPTPKMFIEHLRLIMMELFRILKPTGSLFLNMGDSYAGSLSGFGVTFKHPRGLQSPAMGFLPSSVMMPPSKSCVGTEPWIKPKQLMMIPERLAIGMMDDGWILRNKIIWAKNTATPCSAKDRFKGTYELIFYFVKDRYYYFNLDRVRMPYQPCSIQRAKYGINPFGNNEAGGKMIGPDKGKTGRVMINLGKGAPPGDVWILSPSDFKGQHFATFPYSMVKLCLLATIPREVCSKCGKPKLERFKLEMRTVEELSDEEKDKYVKMVKMNVDEKVKAKMIRSLLRKKVSLGEEAMCNCNEGWIPGIMLDPFSGSGQASVVAKRLGFRYSGIDMKQQYCDIANARLKSML